MAQRVEILSVTVPVNTTQASPQQTSLTFRQGIVELLELVMPPGPSGLVGVRFLHSGQVVIPYSGTGWVITDDEVVSWPLADYPTGEAWAVQAYNNGIYPHTFQVRMLYNEMGTQRLAVVQRLDLDTTTPVPEADREGVEP